MPSKAEARCKLTRSEDAIEACAELLNQVDAIATQHDLKPLKYFVALACLEASDLLQEARGRSSSTTALPRIRRSRAESDE